MAELDKSRDLTFVRGHMTAADGTPGLGMRIPITAPTPSWSAAFHELAAEQRLPVTLTRERDQLFLQMNPGSTREELMRTLNQVLTLINQATQLEREKLDVTSPLEEAALDWWQRH